MCRAAPFTRLVRTLILIAGVTAAATAPAEETPITSDDTVALRVMNWDPVAGAVVDWTALSGEFRVRPDGMLDLPFIEPMQALGRTTVAVSEDVVAALRERFALSEAPDVSLHITDHRPVVVSGVVRDPGEVEFTHGMTVRHAIALAGGPERMLQPGTEAFRDMINTRGALHLLSLERMRLAVTLARLRAERDGRTEIAMPAGLSGAMADRLLAEEAEIMSRRRERIAAERVALGDRIELLDNEIETLQQQLTGFERQRMLAQEALDNVTSLASEGLAVSNRVIESERSLFLLENQLLDISAAILRARLDSAATQRELDEIEFRQGTQIVEQMMEIEARLADTEQRIDTTASLIDVDDIRVAEILSIGHDSSQTLDASYRIYRSDGSEIEAGLGTRLHPGDLVEMSLTGTRQSRRIIDTN